jgi:hypothetical protein
MRKEISVPNWRTTMWMAGAATLCGLLLWTLEHWSASNGPEVSDAPGMLFPRGLGDVDSLLVEQGSFRMGLQRQAGRWSQVEPFAAEVDQVAVRRMLDALADITVRERISLDELRRRALQLKDFGLSPAQTRVVLRGGARRVELDFGHRTPDGGEVYFYLDAASQVLVTPRAALDAVPLSLETVRERALLHDAGRAIAALELRRAGMPYIRLARAAGDWQMTQPYAAAADPARVEAILSGLHQARIEAFVWPSGTNAAEQAAGSLRSRLGIYGLDADAAVQVQLWEGNGAAGVRLRFGRAVEGRPGLVYALTADEQSVVAVTNAVLAPLLAMPSDLRDRRLFRETPDEIARVQLRFAEQLIECRRDEKRRWSLVSPQQDAADQEQVGRLLVGLLRLQAQHVVDPPAGTVVEVGLPTNALCVVELGSAARTNRFAVTPGETAGLLDVVFTNAPTRYLVVASNLPAAVLAPAGAFALRDRTVLAVSTSAVKRITVRRDAETEAVERVPDSDVWQVATAPAGKAVAADALLAWLGLLNDLAAARIERLGATARDLEGYGLAEPAMEIDVDLLTADALRKVLLVGRPTADGSRFAQLRGHDVVFVLAPETMRIIARRLVQPVAAP